MTRNEILNNADAETKVNLIFKKWKYCCRQDLATSREEELETWKELCRNRFSQLGDCLKCKAEFLNMEVTEDEK